MQHSIRLSFSLAGTTALALASIPFGAASAEDTKVAQGTAADLGVMSISLKDAIQPNFGFQGALQGAGTPNQAGIGGFLQLVTGDTRLLLLLPFSTNRFSILEPQWHLSSPLACR